VTLCVIPARGGSKGVPRKNLLDVGGKPLIVWTIEQALAVPELDVLVSTDDEEIAEVARSAGARVPWLRPAELAQDTTPTEPVVRHAIEQVSADRGRPDAVMLLQATSPVRHDDTLARALAEFADTGVDSMVGAVEQPPFIWQAGDPPTAAYDVTARPRRQDLTDATRRRGRTTSPRGGGARSSPTRPGAPARPARSTCPVPRSTSSTTTASAAASVSS